MKINPIGNPKYITGSYRAGKTELSKAGSVFSSTDKVSLSEDALRFSRILAEAKVNAAQGADDDRIASIRSQIQAGTYNIDSGDIAESIIGDLLG